MDLPLPMVLGLPLLKNIIPKSLGEEYLSIMLHLLEYQIVSFLTITLMLEGGYSLQKD